MKSPVIWGVCTLGLLVTYHAMRYAAARCTGSVCDGYIPVSLLLPILCWIAAVLTGVTASVSARNGSDAPRAGYPTWIPVLAVATALSFVGPIGSLLAFRDNPDAFVLFGTVSVAIAPAAALVYAYGERATN